MRTVSLLPAALLAAGAARAEAPPGPLERSEDWRLEAAATLHYEHYDVKGDATQGPYPFEGSQPSATLDLDFVRRLTPWRSLRVKILSLLNDSDYRSPYDGVVPERISVVWEDGEAALPLRLELGDSLGYFTQRTLERPLKGVQLELQTTLGAPDRRTSLQVLSGAYRSSWRGLEFRQDWTSGVSWLVEDPDLGTWSLNFVDTLRGADRDGEGLRTNQRIFGLAASRRFLAASHDITVEGEFDHLESHVVETFGGERGAETEDRGWFAQVVAAGRSPLSFRLRFEDYGRDYRPIASPVTIPDRRSGEGHLGWRFADGSELRARLQRFRDGRATSNPLDTTTVGASLSGPFLRSLAPGLASWLDFYVQDLESRDGSVDQRIATLNVDLWRSLGGWAPRLTAFWQDVSDDTAFGVDRSTLQVQLRSDSPIELFGMRGSFGPGLLYRRIRGGVPASEDWLPTAALRLACGPHSFETAVDYHRQDRRSALGEDVDTLAYRLLYRFTEARDFVDLELHTQARDPDTGEDTDSYRASLQWTHRFAAGPREARARRSRPGPALAADRGGAVDLAEIAPGSALAAVERRLRSAGAPAPTADGRLRVWETRLLGEIDARQRLAVEERDGEVARAALVIEPPRGASAAELLDTHGRVRRLLVDRWGRPDSSYAQGGEDPGQLFDAVARGSFVRIDEWVRAEGMLRLGIPRRLDGQVRIEVQFAEDFPALRDTLWSMESLR